MTEDKQREAELVARAAAGEPEALSRLLSENAAMVHALANRYTQKRPVREDLVHEGYLGLLRAVDGFDSNQGTRFSTYARYWVRYYQQRFARKNRRVVTCPRTRAMVKARNRARTLRRELAQERGEPVTDEELAEHLGVDVDDVAYVRAEHAGADVSIHQSPRDPLGVQLESRFDDPETVAERRELGALRRQLVHECLEILDGRERHIVDERILSDDKHTLAAIGEEMGISRERVRQLEKRALGKMRRHLEHERPADARVAA